MRLKGKTALISGAGRNNGKAIALTFAREGADVILVARTGDDVKQVAQQCEGFGVRALPIAADVGKLEEINRVVQLGLAHFGKVDVHVSVAALRPHKYVWEYSYDTWHDVFAVNVHATFRFAKALAPGMIERRSGSIIALGSAGSSMTATRRMGSLEVAGKHSLYGLIKSLALDFGHYGVRANLLAVASINSEERRNPEWYPEGMEDGHGEAETKDKMSRQPLRRKGSHQEVANVAVFLASDESSFVTGDRICCGGGRQL